jgi:hypothetical protein
VERDKVLVVTAKGKRAIGRPRCKFEDNIKVDPKQMGGRT